MIKTLKKKTSIINLGNIQIQPLDDDLSVVAKEQLESNVSTKDVQLNVSSLSKTGDLQTSTTIQSLASSVVNDKSFILPQTQKNGNSQAMIFPSYASLSLNSIVPSAVATTTTIVSILNPAKKYESYESLTGFTNDRPEIVLLSAFLPLFVSNNDNAVQPTTSLNDMTDAGQYVDVQLNVRSLVGQNQKKLVSKSQNKNARMKILLSEKKEQINSTIENLVETADFLTDVVKRTDSVKLNLDPRAPMHVVNTTDSAAHLNSSLQSITGLGNSFDQLKNYITPTFSVVETLVDAGFSKKNIDHFTSTKVWLQLINELKIVLEKHSLKFNDTFISDLSSDVDPSNIVVDKHVRFSPSREPVGSPTVNDLVNTTVLNVNDNISKISKIISSLYSNQSTFKNAEAKISSLLNFLSKEYRYSIGLSLPIVQKSLSNGFSYNVQQTNEDIFDAIIGSVGKNIIDVRSAQEQTLVGLSQQQPSTNLVVLPFETSYLEGDFGTVTPGTAYYVDDVFSLNNGSFNTEKIDSYVNSIERIDKNLTNISAGMNFFGVNLSSVNDDNNAVADVVSNPTMLAKIFGISFLEAGNKQTRTQVRNDNLGSVYALAASNNKLKSILFMYTMANVLRAYYEGSGIQSIIQNNVNDNTALLEKLADLIVEQLESIVPNSSIGNAVLLKNTTSLTSNSIKTTLKTGSLLSRMIEQFIKDIYFAFIQNNAFVSDKTRFNGILDSTVMLALFDALITMIAKYGGQSFSSIIVGSSLNVQGPPTFVISKTYESNQTQFNDLLTRLEGERAYTTKLFMTVSNVLKRQSSNLRSYSQYLNNPSSKKKISEISNILNDESMLKIAFTQQQSMLLASAIYDLRDVLKNSKATVKTNDQDDEIEFLNDHIVTPKLKNALYSAFSTDAFTTSKGFNKKIISVGVPLGLAQRLKSVVKIRDLKNNSGNKQLDIVKVAVHRVDVQNSDIVFKPQKFMFELSRFPVRNSNKIGNINEGASLRNVITAFPTRDLASSELSAAETYFNANSSDNNSTFSDKSYSFLTEYQKEEIVTNHVLSYLLEIYMKLIAGMNVGDYAFDFDTTEKTIDKEVMKEIVDQSISDLLNNDQLIKTQPTSTKTLFGSISKGRNSTVNTPTTNVATGKVTAKTNSQLNQLSSKSMPAAVHSFTTINGLSNVFSSISDSTKLSKRMLSPKKFDRVFNLIIDPDDFEIDYDETTNTSQGKYALEQLISTGEIISIDDGTSKSRFSLPRNPSMSRNIVQSRFSSNVNQYKFREKNSQQGNLTFDKYIITIETFDDIKSHIELSGIVQGTTNANYTSFT